MTNDRPQSDVSMQAAVDPELDHLLSDAYATPPVPRSLLRRIDGGISQEWGISPRLAESQAQCLSRSLSDQARAMQRRARWLRTWPVAASVGLLIVIGVIFTANGGGYAWADMVEAMVQRGLIQIEGPEGPRWLSLAEGVIIERTPQSSQLVDVRRQTVLSRIGREPTIQRYRISPAAHTDAHTVDPDRMLVGFLVGGTALAADPQRLQDLQLLDEHWEKVSTPDRREQIVLRARFQAGEQSVQVQLRIDPDSQLPLEGEVTADGAEVSRVEVSYPDVDLQQLREREFPPELRVVDTDSPAAPPDVALVPEDVAVDPPAVPPVDEPVVSAIASDDAGNGSQPDSSATLLAATSQWSAVAVGDLPEGQIVQQVDATLERLWLDHGVDPAPPADHEELLRRVYLDLTGRTPSVQEVRAYLKDTSEDRYEQLVDRLLASPDHASHVATVWRTFLIPEGVDLAAFGGVASFDQWLAERFAANEAYDEIVRSLLLAEGRLSRSGPLLFYSAVKLDPDQLAARTARVFLGMRLECAQCHDHPFEAWTQEDFWSYAAFFARISRPRGELENVSTVMRVRDIDRGDVMLPETETVVPPRFLDRTPMPEGEDPRRVQLARWLTSPENPYFARAAANRVWGQMFGRGIIDPVDDFGLQNPPTSPELLDLLAGHFIRTGFDLRELFRTMALSRAYRLSSGAEIEDERRLELFAQMNVKTLTAEQVYDCISVATMLDSAPAADPYDFNVVRFGNTDREMFLQQFRTPVGRTTEYQGGIPQALTLMNGRLIDGATGLSSSGLLESLEAPFFTNDQRIEVLYMATLSRAPRESERELLATFIPEGAGGATLREGLSDLLWALLNSAEFTMNH